MESPSRQQPTAPASTVSAKEEALRIARGQPPAKIKPVASQARPEGWRETVESIVVAFVLAFLFRTFVAEAFVIPTGSMAETLYGRHKDVVCEQCGTTYRVGASEEVDRDDGLYREESRIVYAYCPNCRYRQKIYDAPVFKGDRILVNKFPYEFHDPKPWDVVVFKYPDDPKTNYIKRLIGLPGETITIEGGDIYHRRGDRQPKEILRKPLQKQREMQMLVYDNDKPAKELLDSGYPERWAAVAPNPEKGWSDADGWIADPPSRSFRTNAQTPSGTYDWLRYRNYVPTAHDWERAEAKLPPDVPPQPLLISDFYGYNGGQSARSLSPGDALGENWVGDLTLNCNVEVLAPKGELIFELVKAQRRNRCVVDLATGKATLLYQDDTLSGGGQRSDEDIVLGQADTPLAAAGNYRVSFANVDGRLALWVNDRVVEFVNKEGQDNPLPTQPEIQLPSRQDLCPAGIAAKGADVRVSHLLLTRDIYYTQGDESGHGGSRSLLSDPAEYADLAQRQQPKAYELADDEFLVLGDNSPRSADSRLWNRRPIHPYAVPRNLLIGKAFFIYWPHGVPFGNHGRGYAPDIPPFNSLFYHRQYDEQTHTVKVSNDYPAFTIPFYPQFSRMHRIR
jgi:signal peptidase I